MKLPKNYKIKYKGKHMGVCHNCGKYTLVTWHHCIYNTGRRKWSDRYDLVVELCSCGQGSDCHNKLHIHDPELAEKYRVWAQEKFGQEHPELNFLEIFGKNYL